jgi:chromosome segregation ATPase
MSNNRSWLEIAEYVSVGGSVIGSAIAAVSEQVIYGLAPVSLSLFLNLINRRQLELLSQQSSAASGQVQQLQSAVNSLSVANTKVKQDLQNLVPRQELTSIVSTVENLNQQHNSLRISLVTIQSRLDDLVSQFNKRPELEQIESLAVVITALKQSIDILPQPELLQRQSAELQQQVESALAQLSEKITELSNNRERVQRLEDAIAQLQQQLELIITINGSEAPF